MILFFSSSQIISQETDNYSHKTEKKHIFNILLGQVSLFNILYFFDMLYSYGQQHEEFNVPLQYACG